MKKQSLYKHQLREMSLSNLFSPLMELKNLNSLLLFLAQKAVQQFLLVGLIQL
jgi:hypothetical protein